MSFLNQKNIYKIPYVLHKKNNSRKEYDSLLAIHFPLIFHKKERASAFTSKGSITLEAAVVVPVFFFAMLCMVYLFEMMSIQTTMRNALYSVGKHVAQEAYISPVVSISEIEQQVIQNIGEENLDGSIIVDGADGINCRNSKSNLLTAVVDLSVCYDLEIPVLMFDIPTISCEETLRIKGWTGYSAGAISLERGNMVYITDYGLVYHQNMNCTYLDLSVNAVSSADIEGLRNKSGAKYYPCESCGNGSVIVGQVYVTDYGTRYHTSLECSKVKRNIYAVPLDEVYGLGGCSKCVK